MAFSRNFHSAAKKPNFYSLKSTNFASNERGRMRRLRLNSPQDESFSRQQKKNLLSKSTKFFEEFEEGQNGGAEQKKQASK